MKLILSEQFDYFMRYVAIPQFDEIPREKKLTKQELFANISIAVRAEEKKRIIDIIEKQHLPFGELDYKCLVTLINE